MALTGQLAYSQENVSYQNPPEEILKLVDFQRAPSFLKDSKNENVVLAFRDTYKSLEELNQEEMRLAGLRINPDWNIASTMTYITKLEVRKLMGKATPVKGLPAENKIAYLSWSHDESKMAFINVQNNQLELWILDIASATASKVNTKPLNANMGSPITWLKDNTLLIRTMPADRKALISAAKAIPNGPIVSVSDGSKSSNRTYQDLLKNKVDEANFETLAQSEIIQIDLQGKEKIKFEKAIYTSVMQSPDGKLLLINKIKAPYSYIVPLNRFASESAVYGMDGKIIKLVNDVPLYEISPKGFMSTRTGKRNMTWRNDKAAELYYVEAVDGGDATKEAAFRDEVFSWAFPFDKAPVSLFKTPQRFESITWGNDNIALVTDYWWNTRSEKVYTFNPNKANQTISLLFDINTDDKYAHPGEFDVRKNNFGKYVLAIDNNVAYLVGEGQTAAGKRPFIDKINLATKKKERIYQSNDPKALEEITEIVDINKGEIIVRRQTANEYPNYYLKNLYKRMAPIALTTFENPFVSLGNIHKEIITYKRKDGIELSGTLYLPAGYNKKDKLPMVMWAYPKEFKDKNSAGQNSSDPNEFIFPFYGSPIYWVTQGYAILDDAAFPIVGEKENEPNDSFLEQLEMNALAAIDAVDKLGYINRNKVAVGGHSYGAFMTANLLTHTNLFACGIARSGAYNRTLTPFGFQSEERNYWDATETYNTMSPFMHADKMKTPLLLIHGDADNNPGTFTFQSERYFQALKGLGAPTRLVLLPKESHGYAARLSILHVLWEQHQWLEKYLK